jgi:hypothetical protein
MFKVKDLPKQLQFRDALNFSGWGRLSRRANTAERLFDIVSDKEIQATIDTEVTAQISNTYGNVLDGFYAAAMADHPSRQVLDDRVRLSIDRWVPPPALAVAVPDPIAAVFAQSAMASTVRHDLPSPHLVSAAQMEGVKDPVTRTISTDYHSYEVTQRYQSAASTEHATDDDQTAVPWAEQRSVFFPNGHQAAYDCQGTSNPSCSGSASTWDGARNESSVVPP